jgi:hypothetical protein
MGMKGQTKILGNELQSSPLWGDNISIPARWLFICLLLKTDDQGEIAVDEDFRVCSEISGLGIQSSQKALLELEKSGLITAYDDDTVVVHRVGKFRQRQTESQAKAADRVRRWRDRNRTGNNSPPQTPPLVSTSTVQVVQEVQEDLGGPPVEPCSDESSSNEPRKTKRWADRPADVDEGVWLEFISLRRAKKATATDRVITGLRKQAGLAGLTLQEAMETCIQHGWTSVKAEWLNKNSRRDNRKVYRGDMSEAGEIDF